MSLYPTPNRLAFLADIHNRLVYSQPEGDVHRESYYAAGRKVTALARECEQAGWIERGASLQLFAERWWWQLTELGKQVAGLTNSIEKEQSNG